MGMCKHTPGPWVAFYKRKYGIWLVSLPSSDSSMRINIFPNGVPGDTDEECEANARLIAAAPEMLKAAIKILNFHCASCGQIASHCQRDKDGDIRIIKRQDCARCHFGELKLAVAKAEGRQ